MWGLLVTLCAEFVNFVAAVVTMLFLFPADIDYHLEMAWQIHYAYKDPEVAVFGPDGCDNPCVVRYHNGGWAAAFINMAAQVNSERRMVIDGPCGSSCAIMADYARPYVCVTPNASFLYHMGTYPNGTRVSPPISWDLFYWVEKNGGFPLDGYLVMNFDDASHFWPVCTPKGKTARLTLAHK